MRGRSASRARWLALGVLVVGTGCGPGLLRDLGFGTAGEGDTVASADDSGPDASDSADDGPSPSTTSADSSETVGDDSGDGDSSTTSAEGSTTTMTTTTADGDGDPAEGPDGDGDGDTDDWGGDTWGTPPDVTNEPCEPLTQDCFPTHKCVPFATQPGSTFLDANKCMPILGDKSWGEACTLSDYNEAQDDCDGEGFCWNLEWSEGELHGTCVPFCVGSPQDLMCPTGWGCLFSGAVALCSKQCDPLAQDCPLDYGCYWAGGAFDCALTGTPSGPNQACDNYNDCLPGLACVGKALVPGCEGNDPNCCTSWCDLDGPDPCAPPLGCAPFFEPDNAPPMLDNVGVCIQP
ncbi:hypothetical protein ENSA5_48320 [Enhygromyxa salina]|uniref:Endo-1,4-beta-xylanase A n=1 Tax=Enhygromyxa salina TaxID=215803 RepID=A0A2S9XIU3_9BACT|nr:hypothetical protein [Enhygromyxa salina]PRP92650.1 hypothetical protein ENSA5_48320 [Enhygromyxa salina]